MKQEESLEINRGDAINSWKKRRERDAEIRASFYGFEGVLERLGTKIKEHGQQRTVIAPLHRVNDIIVDRSAQSISMETRPFLFFRKRHIISFPSIISVDIDYRYKRIHSRGKGDTWRISLNTGNQRKANITVDRSNEEQYTFDLAELLSVLIGKEVRENSSKPDPQQMELSFDIDHIPKNLNL